VPKIDQILADVERLVQTVKPREAEERLRSLIGTMGDEELKIWEADLRLTIGRFLPKRRKSLLLVLDRRLTGSDGSPPATLEFRVEEDTRGPDLERFGTVFADELRDLSEHHIFQWSTFYRDVLTTSCGHETRTSAWARACTRRHARHAPKGRLAGET
jgi:hypothetical protein